jgi:hypothetical protein
MNASESSMVDILHRSQCFSGISRHWFNKCKGNTSIQYWVHLA